MPEVNATSSILGVQSANSSATSNLESLLIGEVISNYDDQIKAFSADIKETTAKKSELTSLKNKLSVVPKGVAGTNEALGSYHEYSSKNYKELMALASSVGLQGTLKPGVDSTHANYYVSDAVIGNIQNAIDDQIQNLNSSSDQQMINFQSLMDARKQTLMMLSNMINQDNQTKMAILQNLKS